MARYLIQVSYTAEAWASQIKTPQNRIAAVTEMLAPHGINFEQAYYAFGEYDVVIIAEAPGNVDVSAGILAIAAGGALSSVKTTVLLSADEGMEALKKAGEISYQPPGS